MSRHSPEHPSFRLIVVLLLLLCLPSPHRLASSLLPSLSSSFSMPSCSSHGLTVPGVRPKITTSSGSPYAAPQSSIPLSSSGLEPSLFRLGHTLGTSNHFGVLRTPTQDAHIPPLITIADNPEDQRSLPIDAQPPSATAHYLPPLNFFPSPSLHRPVLYSNGSNCPTR